MNYDGTFTTVTGFAFDYITKTSNGYHPGYAWACKRESFEQMNGLFDFAILGSGDQIMALAFIQKSEFFINDAITELIFEFQVRVEGFILGYTPGRIIHYFHGFKGDREYSNRHLILKKHNYRKEYITKNSESLICTTDLCPIELKDEILAYFYARREDVHFRK